MTNSQLSPKLRFSEFNSEWYQQALNQVVDYTKGFAFKSIDYKTSGRRIVRVSDLGATEVKKDNDKIFLDVEDSSKYQKYLLNEGDIIVTTVGSKPHMKESAVGRGIFVNNQNEGLLNQNLLKIEQTNEINSAFLFYQINTPRYIDYIVSIQRGNANQSNIAVKDLFEYKISITIPAEQQKIADFLSSVDKKIALLKEKHDLIVQYKKGVMQKLFSQEIRFKDEAGNNFPDWKEERLSNILDLQLNALKMKDESEYELITVRRRNGGVDSRGIFKGKDVLVKNQFELKANQFVVSKRQIVHGACGLVPEHLAGAIVSNEYNVFEAVPEKLDITYFNIMATTLPMRRAFFINSDGVHIEKLLFKTQSWLKTKLNFPCVDEQKKIVQFIEILDKKLNLVSEQIKHTQTFKKGLLQQMFV